MKMRGIKGLFCSFCLKRSSDRATNHRSFDQGIDVSHLATPHISSNLSIAVRSSANSTPNNNGVEDNNHPDQTNQSSLVTNCSARPPDPRRENLDQETYQIASHQQQLDNNRPNSSSNPSTPSIHDQSPSQDLGNHLDQLQPSPALSHQQQHQFQQQQQPLQHQPYPNQNGQVSVYQPQQDPQMNPSATGVGTKLSYDIISVREPLAKILAERQQLQQAQQHQRQISADHEYIEVYGDRGSSCFYEEIAGSTTSSATYDQIGAVSNHNYQVLINAYAVANRPSANSRPADNSVRVSASDDLRNHDGQDENVSPYHATHSSDQSHENSENTAVSKPSTSFGAESNQQPEPSTSQANSSDKNSTPSQSVPLYSVINKKARGSNPIIRSTVDSRPPKPPPKNLLMHHQVTATSAIQIYHEPIENTQSSSGIRVAPQIPTTSSFLVHDNDNTVSDTIDHHAGLPQPPPRLSKHKSHIATNRPLPLPDSFENLNNNNDKSVLSHGQGYDEDADSLNNGYELLTTNFDDDQVDVGYEKIRESNRYSGGSLSSQFCPLQALDNGGYESVQPIYSSPSNALAEPNYEAIGPATASELAAAATARLTAAAAVIELMKQDQN